VIGRQSVDVVIVNWNAGDLLRDCVNSVERYGDGIVGSIIVVDNCSTDMSLQSIEKSRAVIDRSGQNLGFARACNRGASQGKADYILFLNPDAAVFAGTIAATVTLMDGPEGQGVGICGVKLVDAEGQVTRNCARFPTWNAMVGWSLGLSGKFAAFPTHFMIDFDHEHDRDVDQVIGAFYFVRRSVFETLDGFDDRFFVYYEDLDFGLRARQLGWRTRYYSGTTAYHKGNGTSDQVKAHRLFYTWRSRMLYGFKFFHIWQAWICIAAILLVEPLLRIGRAVRRGSSAEVFDTVHAIRMLWQDLPVIIKGAHYK